MVDSPGTSRTACASQIFSNIVFGSGCFCSIFNFLQGDCKTPPLSLLLLIISHFYFDNDDLTTLGNMAPRSDRLRRHRYSLHRSSHLPHPHSFHSKERLW